MQRRKPKRTFHHGGKQFSNDQTTVLPFGIAAELGLETASGGNRSRKKKKKVVSRKERRKAERQAKKQRRSRSDALRAAQKQEQQARDEKRSQKKEKKQSTKKTESSKKKRKKKRADSSTSEASSREPQHPPSSLDAFTLEKEKERREAKERKRKMRAMSGYEDDDKEELERLEKKLKVDGGSDYWKSAEFKADGLDDLHDFLGSFGSGKLPPKGSDDDALLGANSSDDAEGDFDEDADIAAFEAEGSDEEMGQVASDESNTSAAEVGAEAGEKEPQPVISEADERKRKLERRKRRIAMYGDGVAHSDSESDAEAEDGEDGGEDETSKTLPPPAKKRRLAAEEGEEGEVALDSKEEKAPTSIVGKYVPRFLRRAQSGEDDSTERLRRTVKRSLNKLHETNIETITNEMMKIYDDNPRYEVNRAVLDLCLQTTRHEDERTQSHCVAFAALITSLHALVDQQIGPFFLEKLVLELTSDLAKPRNELRQKSIVKIVTLIVFLYVFQMTFSTLIFDMVGVLCDSFTVDTVEQILAVLKNCGFRLRKDDPVAFKQLILTVQSKSKALASNEGTDSAVRVSVMLQLLRDVKDNKRRQGGGDNKEESVVHLRKWLAQTIKHKSKSSGDRTLRIGWNDIMDADTKGRWWIIGGAWKGHGPTPTADSAPLKKRRKADGASASAERPSGGGGSGLPDGGDPLSSFDFSEDVLQLAEQQGMNTELKKAIFCVIMSAEDFSDCFERMVSFTSRGSLQRFQRNPNVPSAKKNGVAKNIAHTAERETVAILTGCCAQEKRYNPYYAHVLHRLCVFYRSYQFTTQLAFWDLFKELALAADDSVSKRRKVSNLAQMFAHLLLNKGAITLASLKPLDFAALSPDQTLFLYRVFMVLLDHRDEDAFRQVFSKLAGKRKLKLLREGISLFFLQHFRRKQSASKRKGAAASADAAAKESSRQARIELADACMRQAKAPEQKAGGVALKDRI